jgi:hypothetical protein
MRLWNGAGLLALAGVLLSGVQTLADDGPPLSEQMADLGRQALAQGATETAQTFFKKALELDPSSAAAKRGMQDIERSQSKVVKVAFQDPAPPAAGQPGAPPAAGQPGAPPAAPAPAPATPPPAPAAQPPQATIEQAERAENIARQQLTNEVEERMQAARALLNQGQPEAALSALRLTQNVVRSTTNVPDEVRANLDRRIQAQLLATYQAEERIVNDRAERQRLEAAAEQRIRAVDLFQRNKETIHAMMIQFDTLIAEGVYNVLYNGGYGDIAQATAPFYAARLLAQQANALQRGGPLPYSDNDPAPYAGRFVANAMGFYAQALQFQALEQYRFLLTMQDVTRASIPFPDTITIEYPDAEWWRTMSERRIARWGRAVDLFDRDPKTKQILAKLEEPISMSFANETPLDDILKYIKSATTTPSFTGIPIYVDPIGLQEAEKSLTSTVTIDLEGVPLKTTLKLLLKQLGLTYTVKDGFLMITSKESEDQQTEIRVYPVADLAIIPLSLLGGGGMMGGGMGGMGGGMGGMGGGMGGMGGMGGGMGGMGGGMGGMMSVPPADPQDVQPRQTAGFAQKKRS